MVPVHIHTCTPPQYTPLKDLRGTKLQFFWRVFPTQYSLAIHHKFLSQENKANQERDKLSSDQNFLLAEAGISN